MRGIFPKFQNLRHESDTDIPETLSCLHLENSDWRFLANESSFYLKECLLLQLPDIGDDNTDEEVDHGDWSEEDHEHEQDHGEHLADPVILGEAVVNVTVAELSQNHGQGSEGAVVVGEGIVLWNNAENDEL